jgi:hypothetical protein
MGYDQYERSPGGFINNEYSKLLSLKQRSASVQNPAGRPTAHALTNPYQNQNGSKTPLKSSQFRETKNQAYLKKPSMTITPGYERGKHKSIDHSSFTPIKRMENLYQGMTPGPISKSDINWSDFMNLQNQYREMVSENYRRRGKDINELQKGWYKQQIKDNEKKKEFENLNHKVDDWNTTQQEGINVHLLKNVRK